VPEITENYLNIYAPISYQILLDIQGYYMNMKKGLLVKFAPEDLAKLKQAAQERRLPTASFVRMLVVKQMQLEANGGDLHE